MINKVESLLISPLFPTIPHFCGLNTLIKFFNTATFKRVVFTPIPLHRLIRKVKPKMKDTQQEKQKGNVRSAFAPALSNIARISQYLDYYGMYKWINIITRLLKC